MKALMNVVGGYVVGDRFWGRETEVKGLLELIQEGANISIIAQRRIGKTSLMYEAGRRLPLDFIPLHIDLQGANSAADMVAKLTVETQRHATLWAMTQTAFSNILKIAKENVEAISLLELEIQIRAGLSGNWQEKGSQVLEALAAHEKRVVLFIDELPILVDKMLKDDDHNGEKAVQALLTWLRERALQHQGKLMMVFAGSIGLEPVLNRAGLTANINHLTPFLLEPWSDDLALSCLHALATYRDIVLPKPAAQRMLELLGCNIPHHVQLFFSKIREHCEEADGRRCQFEAVDIIFQQKMLSTQGHTELSHMEERLKKVLNHEDLQLAINLLTHAAVKGSIALTDMHALCDRHAIDVRERTSRLSGLFRIFEHDGYLKKNEKGNYVFVSNLLRQWWRSRFAAFFETV